MSRSVLDRIRMPRTEKLCLNGVHLATERHGSRSYGDQEKTPARATFVGLRIVVPV